MATWEMMLGFEAISAGISLAAILYSMFKKDPAEAAEPKAAQPAAAEKVILAAHGA